MGIFAVTKQIVYTSLASLTSICEMDLCMGLILIIST